MDNFFEAFNRRETHLVTECGNNPYLTAGLHRSVVVTLINGTSKVTMEYRTKPYTTIIEDENMVFNVDVQAVPLNANTLRIHNERNLLKFHQEEATRYLEYEENKLNALKKWRQEFFFEHTDLPDDDDFEYESFENNEYAKITNAPAIVEDVFIDENNRATVIAEPNLITTKMALKHMSSTQQEQQEVKQYLQKINETNKLLLKCEARNESDASKINVIIKASLSTDIQQALENHLKTKHDKTTDQVIALKDPAILMKHIAAVADILYLESYSEE